MQVKLGFKAENYLRRNVIKHEDLQVLKRWLSEEQLPSYSDEQLVQFLFACDSELEATQHTIRSYVRIANNCDELFANRNVRNRTDLQQYLRVGQLCVLPQRTQDDSVVLLIRLKDSNYRNLHMGPYFTAIIMSIQAGIYDKPAKGLIVIFDSARSTWKHMACVRFGLCKVVSCFFHDALPLKLRSIHVINATPMHQTLINAVRPFCKANVLEKLSVFAPGEMDVFYEKHLAKKYFPKDYGGDMPTMEVLHSNNVKRLESLVEYFEAEENQRKQQSNKHDVDI